MPQAVPNYLTSKSDGSTGAVFPGGLELTAQDNATPDAERVIKWVSATSGAMVAQVYAYTLTNGNFINLEQQAGDALSGARVQHAITTKNALGNEVTMYLQKAGTALPSPSNDQANFIVGSKFRQALDGNDRSDFLTGPYNSQYTKVFNVLVGGGGGTSYSNAGDDCQGQVTVAGTAVGVCRVTMPKPGLAGNRVWPVANISDNGPYFASCVVIAVSPFVVVDVYQWLNSGAAANRSFFLTVHYAPG